MSMHLIDMNIKFQLRYPVQSLDDYDLFSPLITITSVESLPTRYKSFSLGVVLTHYD